MANSNTAQWSSRLAFTLAAIGCSVGLGNLWRFSAEAGSNGGGAFIVVYLACVIFIGIPTIMAEFLIGRAGQASSAVNSMGDLAKRSSTPTLWSLGAWVGMLAAFLIVSFYAVVAAWVMAYIPWLVARGVNRGIELASKVLMPAFFVLLLLLSCYSIFSSWESGGTDKALAFLFSPEFSKIDGSVAVSALSQAFFSIGLGMAMMIAYGSYLPKNISIPQSSVIIGLADTAVALIAGLAIFPIVFKYGLDFSAGAGLFFQTLPTALIETPGGNLVGAAFFCMAFFSALTTGVALLEPSVAHASEHLKISKAKAAIYVGIVMILVGFGSLFSIEFLDFLDGGLTAPILLPLSALLVVLFVGWRLDKSIIDAELSDNDRKTLVISTQQRAKKHTILEEP